MDSAKIDEREACLQKHVVFINKANETLAGDLFTVDLTAYDLDNQVSLGLAQSAQALASQYVTVMAEKVDFHYHDFLVTLDSIESFFRDFHISYLDVNPRPRGYPEELHTHAASKLFLEQEGWDRDLANVIAIKYKQTQKTLAYRREHLSEVHFQLKEKLRNLTSAFNTQGGSQIITPSAGNSFTDLTQPNPTHRSLAPNPYMGIPPPASMPPTLPPGFQVGNTD